MVIIIVKVGLQPLHDLHNDELFDCSLLLVTHLPFFCIVLLPLSDEEVHQSTKPLAFSLDLPLPLTEMSQPDDVCGYSCITYGLNHSGDHMIELEAFSPKINVISFSHHGDVWSWLSVEHIAVNRGIASHDGIDSWLSIISFYIEGHVVNLLRYPPCWCCVGEHDGGSMQYLPIPPEGIARVCYCIAQLAI